MIRSCLDLDAITIDGSTSSDVQAQLRDKPRSQKMTHVMSATKFVQYSCDFYGNLPVTESIRGWIR
jgi:hypothetical protein